jgi:hypothetical protein
MLQAVTGRQLLSGSLSVLLLALVPIAALGQPLGIDVEIISRRHSTGYLPVVEGYAEYEVKLTNTDDSAIENRSLQVSLLSNNNNKTHTFAEYSIPFLGPKESRIFHLGPFKLLEEGEHRLLIGMKNKNSPNEMESNYQYDSFTVYRQDAIWALYISISLLAVGAGISGYSFYRRRKKHT